MVTFAGSFIHQCSTVTFASLHGTCGRTRNHIHGAVEALEILDFICHLTHEVSKNDVISDLDGAGQRKEHPKQCGKLSMIQALLGLKEPKIA